MIGIGKALKNNNLDGAVSAASDLKGMPTWLQSYITFGNKKLDVKSFGEESPGLDNYITQLTRLDRAQQSALLSMTELSDRQRQKVKDTIQRVNSGKALNGLNLDESLKNTGLEVQAVNSLLGGMRLKTSDGSYLTRNIDEVNDSLNEYLKTLSDGRKAQLEDANLIKITDDGVVELTENFKNLLVHRSADTTQTWGQKFAQDALNVSLQLGKQVLLSFGVAALSFIATKIVDYFMNLKTASEQLVANMEDAQTKLQDVTSDVDELESKIDELNQAVKNAGANQIKDIVDPDERNRIQIVNDMLQAQLELKKQLEADAKNEANAATSAVYSDKTKRSIYHTDTESGVIVDAGSSNETYEREVGQAITTTESLEEHSQHLNELAEERIALATELAKKKIDPETDERYKELGVLIEDEISNVTDLSKEVSVLADGYQTDADKFGEVEDEYIACTDAITNATNALKNANGEIEIATTKLTVAKNVVQRMIETAESGDVSRGNHVILNAIDRLKATGVETDQDMLELLEYPLTQTDEQREAFNMLSESADILGVSVEDLVNIFVQLGEIDIGEAPVLKELDELCDSLEKVQSAYSVLKEAADDYNSANGISYETLSKLVELDTEFLKYLSLENDQIIINEEGIESLADSYYELMKAKVVSNAIDSLREMDTYSEAADYLSQAKQETKDWIAMMQSVADITLESSGTTGDGFDTLNQAQQQVINSATALFKLIEETQEKNPLGKLTDSSSTSSALDVWSTLSSAMEEYNKNGSICLTTMKSLMSLDAKYTSLLKKQGDELVVDATAFRNLVQAELKQEAATDSGSNKVAQYNQILSYLDENAKNGVISLDELRNAIEGVDAAISKALEQTDRYQSAMQTLHELKTLSNANSGGTSSLFNTDGMMDYDTIKKVTELINEYPDISGILIDESGNLKVNQDTLNESMEKVVGDMITAAEDSNKGGLAQLWENQLDKIKTGDISWEDFWNGFATGIEDANAKLDEFQSNFSTLKDAMEEFNKYGEVSQDTLQELAKMDSAYSGFLSKDSESGKYSLDAIGFRDSYVDLLESYSKQFDGTIFGDQIKAMIEAVRKPTEEEYERLAKQTTQYIKAKILHDQGEITDEELNDVLQQALLDVVETDAQVSAKLVAHWIEVGNSAEAFEESLSNIKDLLESFLDLLENANSNRSNDLSLWGDAVQDELDDRIEALEKQKEALEDNNDEVERAIELSRLQDELARAQNQKTARVYTSNGYEWQSDSSAVRDAQQNLSDKQREWKKEDAEKAIDDQIDKLNELKDKYSDAMADIGTSWDDYNKKLKYSAQLQGMTFTDMEGQLDGYKDSIVSNMKQLGSVSGMQNFITSITTTIETLEKLNDVLTWVTSSGAKTDGGGFSGLLENISKALNGELKVEVKDGLTGISSVVNDWVTSGSGKNIVNSITGVFKTATEKVGSLFSGKNGLTGIVSAGLSSAGSAIGKVGKGIVSVAKTVGSGIGSALNIGSLAAGGAAATAVGSIPVVGALLGAVGMGVNSTVQMTKKNKEIWNDDSKSTGSKILSTIGNTLWSSSPFGIVANGVKTISGFVKKIFGIQDKDSKNDAGSSGNTVTNISSSTNTNITNITTNGTQTSETTESTSSSTSTSDVSTGNDEQKKQSLLSKVMGSKLWFWNWGKRASGDKGIKRRGVYNVDERGSELLVRQPQSGRYTYLETGDGVIPADITSRLFEMGGNPDRWFSEQMAKHGAANMIQNRTSGGTSYNIGDININNPIGDSDALARDIVSRLPSCVDQRMNKR